MKEHSATASAGLPDTDARVCSAKGTKPVSVHLDDERVVPGTSDASTYQAHLARYQFVLPHIRNEHKVLETACGAGYGTQLLSRRARSVVGTDYSRLAIEYARKNHGAANLEYLLMDCHRLAFPDAAFDLVISFEVFEHLEDSRASLAECCRVLRPGGRLFLSTPNRAAWELHMRSIHQAYEFHINLVDLDDLRLRLFSPQRRERMQQSMGVPVEEVPAEAWVFSRSQLRQANHFVAVCRKLE